MSEQTSGQFSIQRIFLKDASFEAPNAPECFLSAWKPEVKLDINTRSRTLKDDHYHVSLQVTATAQNNEQVAFIAEVEMSGVFLATGLNKEKLRQMLGAFCPNLLFPYVREQVDQLVVKGNFPALMLSPINFEALYQQKQAKEQGEGHTKH